MKIEIKNRYTGEVILCGKHASIKDCFEKNRGVNLSLANLSGSDLYKANLSGANLSGSNLSGSHLSGANLSGSDLYKAYLSGADLSGADLSGADLSLANLSGSNLSGSHLSGADLSGANLSRANLSESYLSGANLSGADLSESYLSNIKGYSESHDIFMELIRNHLIKFSKGEQEIASRVFALRLCWESIKKEYGKEMGSIFKKLKELGYDEYQKKWIEIKKDSK
jgi:hypothetical protein